MTDSSYSPNATLRATAAQRVVMLVNNPCTNDSRVIREAEALAATGLDVTVLARRGPGLPAEYSCNGVTYVRVSGLVETWVSHRERQAAWRATQAFRARHRNWLTRLKAKPLAWVAYACTWRRPVVAPPSPVLAGWSDARPLIVSAVEARTTSPSPSAVAPISKNRPETVPAAPVEAVHTPLTHISKESTARTQESHDPCTGTAKQSPQSAMQTVRHAVFKSKRLALAVPRRMVSYIRRRLKNCAAYIRKALIPVVIFEDVDVAMGITLEQLNPDVIHAHDLITLPTAGRVARLIGARLVYDSHELELHRNARYSSIAQWFRARMEKRYITLTDLVITVSDSIANHLAAQYRIRRPLVVLNSPSYNLDRHHTRTTLRAQLGLSQAEPLAVYVGRVTFGRGLDFCVRALAHDSGLRLAAVGPREATTEKLLRALAAEIGVEDRFHLVDPVSPDAVVSFIKDADVSLLPIQNVCLSYYYCMPNKLLESVMSGLPVAVANLIELRRFVETNHCGVVMDETDPADIARTIRHVWENKRKYLLDPSGIDAMKQRYSWETQAKALAASYPLRAPASAT